VDANGTGAVVLTGNGLSYTSTPAVTTNTDAVFSLTDTVNEDFLAFADVAAPTNFLTYAQRVASDPGWETQAGNGTATAEINGEAGSTPRVWLEADTGSNTTRFTTTSNDGGVFEFQNGAASSTAQLWVSEKAFTDAATIDLAQIGITSGSAKSGELSYTAIESGGGIIIANRGVFSFTCVNEADAEVCTSGGPGGGAFAELTAVDGDSGATMACTPAITPGTNNVMISLACNTSSAAGGTIYWKLESESDITNMTLP